MWQRVGEYDEQGITIENKKRNGYVTGKSKREYAFKEIVKGILQDSISF